MAAQFATECSDNPLWEYALALYQRDGVKEYLLMLQNEQHLDVLLLITDAWLRMQKRDWQQGISFAEYRHWRTAMIVPLRGLRQQLVRDAEPLRSQLLAAELTAEKEGIQRLYRALTTASGRETVTLLNMPVMFYQDVTEQKKEAVRPLFQRWVTLSSC